MNDPHVAALIYQVRHHEGVDYSRAVPSGVRSAGLPSRRHRWGGTF